MLYRVKAVTKIQEEDKAIDYYQVSVIQDVKNQPYIINYYLPDKKHFSFHQ